MKIHNLVQGSDEWCQFRLSHFGASEAAAMLGLSKKVKRSELLHMKHTGIAREFSDWVQKNILDHGHEVEKPARVIEEQLIGDDLYPVTCSNDLAEGSGDDLLSASCDGRKLDATYAWEHKQWNAELAAAVEAGELPEEHMPQAQQILLVTGDKLLTFTVSDGTEANRVSMTVLPDEAWFARIRAGWAQFRKDLAEYVPVEIVEKPKAEAIMQLPALAIQIRGDVVSSNLPAFKEAATQFIASIKTELATDEDFAQAEATVKFCEKAEKDLELTKSAAIAQTASIDELMRTIDHIQAQLREKRLALDKLVVKQKEAIKLGILSGAKEKFAEHIAGLEAEIEPIRLVCAQPDFPGAMKNKRTLASLHDAVNTTLANAKIAADSVAKGVRGNLGWFKEYAKGYEMLFADLQQIIYKNDDDFELAVQSRIDVHKKVEADRLEAERVRIAAELAAASPAPVPVAASPQASVLTSVAPAPASSESSAMINLGAINAALGFTVSAEFLAKLGFVAETQKNAKLYREADFHGICAAITRHVLAVASTSFKHAA